MRGQKEIVFLKIIYLFFQKKEKKKQKKRIGNAPRATVDSFVCGASRPNASKLPSFYWVLLSSKAQYLVWLTFPSFT